jgi:carotenoid cleavage dioxygenase-like enzyme
MNAKTNPGRAPSAPGCLNRADRAEHDHLELSLVTTPRGPWPGWAGHQSNPDTLRDSLPGSGPIPAELFGHLFVNSAAGTLESRGLPLTGDEVTTILAGDAYMMRFDLDGAAGKVSVKTSLLRTPCFYVDEATRDDPSLKLYRFSNHGILRFNWLLGARNMNNTAFYPLPAKGQKIEDPCRLLVTWDAGRPWEIDPITLEAKTPVGTRKEWVAEALGTHPFPVTFSTAHPQWDSEAQQLFTINYGKGIDALMRTVPIMDYIGRLRGFTSQRINEILFNMGLGRIAAARIALWRLLNVERTNLQDAKPAGFVPQRFTYLLRWDGKGAVQRFQVVRRVDPTEELEKLSFVARLVGKKLDLDAKKGRLGASVAIGETCHQMCVTRNFVVILDTGFKVGLDALYGDPLPFMPGLRGLFKTVTTRAVTPYSTFHIVRRADLDESMARWSAKSPAEKLLDRTPDVEAVTVRLPSAACHFVADFEDDGHTVVLHVAHSDATDVGEWVRQGAMSPYTDQAVDEAYYGLPGISAIDTNRLARYTVDVDNHRVMDTSVMSKNPFTWTVALYAEQTAGIPANFSEKVKSLYWNSMGFFPELATSEMRELYEDYVHRSTPLAEIDNMPATGGRPSTLMRLDIAAHQIADHFILPPGFVCSSPQFLPRTTRRPDIPEHQDGFLSAIVFVPDEPGKPKSTPELWIFDAADLGAGPLCMLHSPKLSVGFTIHSAWLGALQPYDPSVYKIDLEEDFADSLDNLRRGVKLKSVFQEIYKKF